MIQSLDGDEFTDACSSTSYLDREHKELAKKWLIHINELPRKPSDIDKYWEKTIREIRYWEEQEIDYMYQRVMELSRQILKSQYFKVQTHSGEGTVPDRTTILNRLVELSEKLLSEIYPSILRLVDYRTDTVERHIPYVNGNINWNKTILHAVNTSAGIPTTLVCRKPERSFSTPENLLLYIAVTWIFNDAVHFYSFQKMDDVSNEDKNMIWRVLKSSKIILESFLLRQIKKDSVVVKQFTVPTPKIKPALALIEKKLKHSVNPQTPYHQLITWMKQYVDFSVNRYHDLANFTFQNTKDFDKMFELWVLLEMAHHIGNIHNRLIRTRVEPLIEANSLKGFKFEINNHIFTLHYEKCYIVPMGGSELNDPNNHVTPDYVIEANEYCCCGNMLKVSFDDSITPTCECGNFTPRIVLVMDAKNWLNSKRLNAVKTMAWYMIQLNRYHPMTAILFFSNYERHHNKEDPRTEYWNPVTVNQGNWEFINYVVKSSRNPKYIEQLHLVFEQISSRLFSLMS